jgi:hypothetical protein
VSLPYIAELDAPSEDPPPGLSDPPFVAPEPPFVAPEPPFDAPDPPFVATEPPFILHAEIEIRHRQTIKNSSNFFIEENRLSLF